MLASNFLSAQPWQLSTCHVAVSLPMNNETCIEIASPTAACLLQPSFCAEFCGVGMLHPILFHDEVWSGRPNTR